MNQGPITQYGGGGSGSGGINQLTGDVTAGPGTGSQAATIADDAVTYAKMQNVSATDKVLGRSSVGAGNVEEIACTAAGRALIDDADAAAQRTTLGLGALAVKSTVATSDIDNDAVTYAKIQNVSATDKVLGRSTSGAGDVEEIACTSAGRALIDDADASAQRTTLGLGGLAVKTTVATGDIDNDAVTYAKIQNVSATDKVLGRSSSGAGDVEEIACTAAGRALIDDADASAQRTTLGLGSLATKSTINNDDWSGTDLAVTNGGTGSSTAAAARTALGIDVASVNFVIEGGGATITTGIKGDLVIPFACTITEVTLVADQSGSIVIDIWKDTYANFPPTAADSITASAKPTISTATKSQDGTLTGWTTSVSAGDILRFNVDSVTSIQRVTLHLKVTR